MTDLNTMRDTTPAQCPKCHVAEDLDTGLCPECHVDLTAFCLDCNEYGYHAHDCAYMEAPND